MSNVSRPPANYVKPLAFAVATGGAVASGYLGLGPLLENAEVAQMMGPYMGDGALKALADTMKSQTLGTVMMAGGTVIAATTAALSGRKPRLGASFQIPS